MTDTNVYNIREMPKQSESIQPQNTTYTISKCQERLKKTKTTKSWLQVLDVLQITRDYDKSRILHAIFDVKDDVVVKIGDENLKREYAYGTKLKKVKGFIKFDCFFECDDDYLDHPNEKRKFICKGPGDSMQAIVMPYYPSGSMKSFAWNPNNKDLLRSSMKQACLSIYTAFVTKNIIHGDFHAGNILLNKTTTKQIVYKFPDMDDVVVLTHGYKTVIMDFENSSDFLQGTEFEKMTGLNNFYFDLKKFFNLFVFYVPTIDKRTIYNVEKAINSCIEACDHPLNLFKNGFLGRIDEIDYIL